MLAGHRIDALIGEGGMGVVYRATHLNLRRTVALKVLPPALAADVEFRRRFEREATIAASLEHPAVVPIYDAGHENGVLYLSMRYVEGEDLGAVLRREGPLDVARLCGLLEPVADALDAVHDAGLVHRDVKPGNILIARPGRTRGARVYLCDFGIAKGAADGSGAITSAGRYFGTLQYSSPEQIQGRWIDGRSDQYGLACLAFRGLTGRVPYPRDDSAAVIYAHLVADPPRPRLLRPDLPAAVDAVLVRATAKDPAHRFPRCSAFVAALRAAVSAPRPAGAPPQRRAPGAGRPAAPPHRGAAEPSGAPVPSGAPAPPGAPAPAGASGAPEAPAPPRASGAAEPSGPAGAPASPGTPARSGTSGSARPASWPPAPAPPGTDAPSGTAQPSGTPQPSDTSQPSAAGSSGPGRPPSPSRRPLPPTLPLPEPDEVRGSGRDEHADGAVPPPVDVRAGRTTDDSSVTVTWTAGGPQQVEYKVSRLAPDGGRWQVVGRTGTTAIIDGAVAADAEVPVYGVVARLGAEVSAVALSATASATDPPPSPQPSGPVAPPTPEEGASGPGDIPAVRELTVSAPGTLVFDWPDGVTEAMVVVRHDRPPVAPDDPAATSWKITNMRYQLDGGLLLPGSVARPCHVGVASCRRERGVLVVAPGFGPTARTSLAP